MFLSQLPNDACSFWAFINYCQHFVKQAALTFSCREAPSPEKATAPKNNKLILIIYVWNAIFITPWAVIISTDGKEKRKVKQQLQSTTKKQIVNIINMHFYLVARITLIKVRKYLTGHRIFFFKKNICLTWINAGRNKIIYYCWVVKLNAIRGMCPT